MADNRTGLSAADLAEQFRDVCGDGSMEWVYTPMQTWLLLDAADMLDEFADAPKCETCEAMLDCDECLRADASQKERKRLDYENAKLRELVWDLYCLAYPSAVEWEVSDETYDKYSPCEKCEELYGGKSPCASTAKDMTEECCAPIQANVVAEHMRELGVEP